jgi:hypothetical protein
MNIEFRYDITHLIALRAGFKSADGFIIAYSRQYKARNERTKFFI